MRRQKFVVAFTILFMLMGTPLAFGSVYTVTDPTDIWIGGDPANGKDIVDPSGGLSIDQEYGNYSSSSFNSNSNRYVFGMDTSEFLTGAGNIPGDINLTAAVSGTDLSITMGSGVQFLSVTPTESTSLNNALALSNYSFRNLRFDRPVEAAGFVVTRIGQPDMTVSFYSDLEGTQLLASYHLDDAVAPDRYNAFIGYIDTTGVGIRCVSAVRGTSTGSATLIDDIVVVVPEPCSIALTCMGIVGFVFSRKRL